MKRRSLSRLMRTRIFIDAGGVCCICNLSICPERGEKWIVEHVKPLWLGGADDETNMRPAHQICAINKTADEAPVKAKNDRQRANFLGIKRQPKGRPMAGTKASGIRRRMSGKVEKWT